MTTTAKHHRTHKTGTGTRTKKHHHVKGFDGLEGVDGHKKHHKTKSHKGAKHSFLGALGMEKFAVVDPLKQAAMILAGIITGKIVIDKMQDSGKEMMKWLAPLVPAAGGLFAANQKNDFLKPFGIGLLVSGGNGLVTAITKKDLLKDDILKGLDFGGLFGGQPIEGAQEYKELPGMRKVIPGEMEGAYDVELPAGTEPVKPISGSDLDGDLLGDDYSDIL